MNRVRARVGRQHQRPASQFEAAQGQQLQRAVVSQKALLERRVIKLQGTKFLVGLAWQRDPAQDGVERLLGVTRELSAERGLRGRHLCAVVTVLRVVDLCSRSAQLGNGLRRALLQRTAVGLRAIDEFRANSANLSYALSYGREK